MRNNKGFMMAEVIVVSAIALVAMASLYVSYNKIYGAYKTRISYNDIKSLNRLIFIRDFLIEDCDATGDNCKINSLINAAKDGIRNVSEEIELPDANNDVKSGFVNTETVYLYYNKKQNFNHGIFGGIDEINNTFKDYVDYLNTSTNFNKTNYVLLIERCYTDDDCKYSYLELYDNGDRAYDASN